MCCSVLQYVAVRCGVAVEIVVSSDIYEFVQHIYKQCAEVMQCVAVCCSMMHCDAVSCSVMQCDAVGCSVLQCVAVRCSVLQCVIV